MAQACSELLKEVGYVCGRAPLDRILAAVGGVVRDELFNGDGRLNVSGDTYVLTVNPSWGLRRRNFTIAHEIGHILLFEGVVDAGVELVQGLSIDHGVVDVERLCNGAAAELLMPRDDFRANLLAQPITPSRVQELADCYDVSPLAAIARVAEVLSKTQILLLHKDSGSTGKSQRYDVVSVLPAGTRFGDTTHLTAQHLHPDLLETCVRTARPARSASFGVRFRWRDSVTRRAIAMWTESPSECTTRQTFRVHRREVSRWPSARTGPLNVDFILLVQAQSAPLVEWVALTRPPRAPLRSRRGKEARQRTDLTEAAHGSPAADPELLF